MRRRLRIAPPFDPVATLRMLTPRAARRRWPPYGGWWVGNTPDGVVTLRVTGGDGHADGEAWGPGAGWVLDRLERFCGGDDHPASFDPPDGPVRRFHRRHRGFRLGHTTLVFEALVPLILGQRVTAVEARRTLHRLARGYGSPAPGPVAGHVAPPAAVVAGLDTAELHRLGVERSRASVLVETARRAGRLEETVGQPLDDGRRRIAAVGGIGPWTAGHVMGVALGDTDAVPVGDYHLPDTVAWALAGEPRADDARMLELLEPYRPHRRRVIALLGLAGVGAPAYGPKATIRDIRRQ